MKNNILAGVTSADDPGRSGGDQARRVLKSAAKLFAERGYDAASVREIVEDAGVAKPTLYYHFGSKEGVAHALVAQPMRKLIETMNALADADMDPVVRLERMIDAHLASCREDPDRARFFFSIVFGPMGDKNLAAEIMAHGEALNAAFRKAIDLLVDSGVIEPAMADRCDALLRGRKIVATIEHVFCKVDLEPGLARRIVSDVLLGCASREGRKSLARSKPAVRKTKMRLGVCLAMTLAGLAAAGCGTPEVEAVADAQKRPRELFVPVASVKLIDVERTVDAVGSLRGWENVTLGAKNTGRVERVFHDIGDEVKPGDIVVQLETADADLAILQAQRKLEVDLARLGLKADSTPTADFDVSRVPTVLEAKVALERARQILSREQLLFDRKVNNLETFQNAENDEKAARAKLETAQLSARADLANVFASKAALEVSKQKRKDAEIRVPTPTKKPLNVEGPPTYVVSKRHVSEGQMIKEGEAVVDVVVANPLRLWANVPERHSGEIKVGQQARVHVPSMKPGESAAAVVARINPTVDSASRTFQVEVAVPNPERRLRPGGFAKVEIITQVDAKAIVVPVASLIRGAGSTKVFVLGPNETSVHAHIIREEKKEPKDLPGWVEVESDIPADAKVVTIDPKDQDLLAEGSPVKIQIRVPQQQNDRSTAAPKSAAKEPKSNDSEKQ